jgi:hypothetical protein
LGFQVVALLMLGSGDEHGCCPLVEEEVRI